jgi:YHS domain-containing protein
MRVKSLRDSTSGVVLSAMNAKSVMKKHTTLIAIAVVLALVAVPALRAADDNHKHADGKDHKAVPHDSNHQAAPADHVDKHAKAYPLKTCVVSGEEIGKDADMKPHVFTYQGQEVKLCCKSCLKDFNKEPAKYLKKIAAAQKK